jgi:hypothetical protein
MVACGSMLACNPQPRTPEPSVIGRWRNWSNRVQLVFQDEGVFMLEMDYDHESTWSYFPGSYTVERDGQLVIDVPHEFAGTYQFELSEDILQLTDSSGDREAYKRAPVRDE